MRHIPLFVLLAAIGALVCGASAQVINDNQYQNNSSIPQSNVCDICETTERTNTSSPLSREVGGKIDGPILVCIKSGYDSYLTNEFFTETVNNRSNVSVDEARTIACIFEEKQRVGSYTDGTPAYRIDWYVELVRVSDGQLLHRNYLQGENPPYFTIPYAETAEEPSTEFCDWIRPILDSS
jgi:hypothetical protein